MWRTTLELTRCTLTYEASKWAARPTRLVLGDRAEAAHAFSQRFLTQSGSLDVLIDEFETRGLRLHGEQTTAVLKNGPLSLWLRGPTPDDALAVELFARIRSILDPIPPAIDTIDDAAFLRAFERMHQRSLAHPADADVARWLSVADVATMGGLELDGMCASCGAPAATTVEVTSTFFQNEEHWAYTYTYICLAEPHLHEQRR